MIKIKKHDRLSVWHKWFAWYPVTTITQVTDTTVFEASIWFSYVERKLYQTIDGYWWEYRLIKKEVHDGTK